MLRYGSGFHGRLCLVAQRKGIVIKMKNNFKISKCAIIAILTFCLLFCISGTQVFAAMAEATEDIPVATENITQELVPVMASRCNDYWAGQPYNAKSVSDRYLMQNGVNPHDLKHEVLGAGANISPYDIYKDSNGGLWLYSGSGSYIPTYTYI